MRAPLSPSQRTFFITTVGHFMQRCAVRLCHALYHMCSVASKSAWQFAVPDLCPVRFPSNPSPGLPAPPSAPPYLPLLRTPLYRSAPRLASDPGILGVMASHQYKVGKLSEMPPEGKVGVSPVCILGVNINAGQEISLRLRTDDLRVRPGWWWAGACGAKGWLRRGCSRLRVAGNRAGQGALEAEEGRGVAKVARCCVTVNENRRCLRAK